jgi:shikimate kinase
LLSSRGKVVYLQASIEQQLERTAKDKRRPLLQVDDKKAQLQKLMEQREPYYQEIADLAVDTSNTTVRNVVQSIIKLVTEDDPL